MKGPSDINDLLSGLKTKSVSINNNNNNNNDNERMTVKRPAKPITRKQKSDKNTVSLDF